MTEREVEGVDYHWGQHPEWGYLTKHVGGSRKDCSGPDCGIEEWEVPPSEMQVYRND